MDLGIVSSMKVTKGNNRRNQFAHLLFFVIKTFTKYYVFLHSPNP